jgi:hypothetical protein
MKEVKDLYNKKYKSLKKKIGEDIKRWKALPCSRTGQTDIVKMAILTKAINIFNAIPINVPLTKQY